MALQPIETRLERVDAKGQPQEMGRCGDGGGQALLPPLTRDDVPRRQTLTENGEIPHGSLKLGRLRSGRSNEREREGEGEGERGKERARERKRESALPDAARPQPF